MNRPRMLCSVLFLVTGSAVAQPIEVPGLLSPAVVRPLLEAAPAVVTARATTSVLQHESQGLEASPYEWTAQLSGQQRRQEDGPSHNEWSIGVERGIRLPQKAAADRQLAQVLTQQADVQYDEAVHEAAREFADLWVEWLTAEQAYRLATENQQSMQVNFDIVQKRMRAGDASKLDVGVADAEVAEQRRLTNEAKTRAAVAWSRLSSRFPGFREQKTALPQPQALVQDDGYWKERILSTSDELSLIRLNLQKVELHARRAQADRIPDPTLGLFTASEGGGSERVTGITVSMPIPGSSRLARSKQASAEGVVARQQLAEKTRQLESDAAADLASARGMYGTWKIAEEGARTVQENTRLTQRAYTLGETDLQALLLAQRQAGKASNDALEAQAQAFKAYLRLLIDAHLVWDLEQH